MLLLHLPLLLLRNLLSRTGFVVGVPVRKPLIPRNSALASCSSRVFRISQGTRKLAVLSVGLEHPRSSLFYCNKYRIVGSVPACLRRNIACLQVQLPPCA